MLPFDQPRKSSSDWGMPTFDRAKLFVTATSLKRPEANGSDVSVNYGEWTRIGGTMCSKGEEDDRETEEYIPRIWRIALTITGSGTESRIILPNSCKISLLNILASY